MFFRLDPIFQAVLRRTEKTDTRMDIRRDESETMGGKKRGTSKEQTPIPWEDTTEVSVVALRNFLEELLGLPEPETSSPHPDTGLPPAPHSPPTAVQNEMARANDAYLKTGRAVHDKNIENPTVHHVEHSPGVQLAADFSERDLSLLKECLEDLRDLEKSGITLLNLRRTLTFLESIRQAIIDAKNLT